MLRCLRCCCDVHLSALTECAAHRLENPPEAGILPDALVSALDTIVEEESRAERLATNAAASTSGSLNAAFASNGGILFHPTEQSQIKESWKHLMRWSRAWRTVEDGTGILKDIEKVNSPCTTAASIALDQAWDCGLSRHNTDSNSVYPLYTQILILSLSLAKDAV